MIYSNYIQVRTPVPAGDLGMKPKLAIGLAAIGIAVYLSVKNHREQQGLRDYLSGKKHAEARRKIEADRKAREAGK